MLLRQVVNWGRNMCYTLAFHSLTSSDFTKHFFWRSKINSFKKLLPKPESMDLMSSMNTNHADIEKVTHFVLHVIYNRPKREKSPPNQKSLAMKILRAHLVNSSLSMVLYNLSGMKGRRYLVKSKFKIISEKKVRCWEVFCRTARKLMKT